MNCPQCKSENETDANFCRSCGSPLVAAPPSSPPSYMPYPAGTPRGNAEYDSNTIASIILGLLSIIITPVGLALGVAAVVFSVKARSVLGKYSHLKGEGLATAGLVMGAIGGVLSILFYVLLINALR